MPDEIPPKNGLAKSARIPIQPVSRDTNRDFGQSLNFGQRAADRVAAFGGSWSFILLFVGILGAWFGLNSLILVRLGGAFDPYPYIFLNLILSALAALQAPVIMMSQNRQASKDRLEARHAYEVNLKAELEILDLHHKFDALCGEQWTEMIATQLSQQQLLDEMNRRDLARNPHILSGGSSVEEPAPHPAGRKS